MNELEFNCYLQEIGNFVLQQETLTKNMVEIGKLSTGVTFSEKFSVISYKENNWKFVYTLSIIFVNKGIYLIKACSECT